MTPLELTQQLMQFESTSNLSNLAVTDSVSQFLEQAGFELERLEYQDANDVTKACVIAKKGNGTGGLGYFAHTDVVPADPWYVESPGPFEPVVQEGKLIGRGSCDMKGSLACMLTAAAAVEANQLSQPVYITATADEEIGYGGAKQVAERSKLFQEMVAGGTKGIIGEPTMLNVVYAHKGAFGFKATAKGVAAHSSTGKGTNANLQMIPFLAEMKRLHDETKVDPVWQNDEFTPNHLTWNIGINDYTYASNITPPQSICTVYYRPMPGMDGWILMKQVQQLAEEHGLELEIKSTAPPVYVEPESAFVKEMLQLAGKEQAQTVSYGTDGAMFTALKEMVVFGPGDIAKAHTHDEYITLDQLQRGYEAYARLIEHFCQ